MAHPMLTAGNYGGAFGPPPGRAANWAERSMSFTPCAPERCGDVASSHKRKRQVMINFHRPIAGSFTVGILVMCVLLAISAPASARGGGGGGGGGGSHGSHGPGRPPPPVFVEGSPAGRAVGSDCYISRRPVTRASSNTV